MEMKLVRGKATASSVEGRLYINGVFECFTVEDKPRDKKVYGLTGIPKGIYNVIITISNRFHKRLPLLLGVPGFEGIRIHSGNAANKETFLKKIPIPKGKAVLKTEEYVEVT